MGLLKRTLTKLKGEWALWRAYRAYSKAMGREIEFLGEEEKRRKLVTYLLDRHEQGRSRVLCTFAGLEMLSRASNNRQKPYQYIDSIVQDGNGRVGVGFVFTHKATGQPDILVVFWGSTVGEALQVAQQQMGEPDFDAEALVRGDAS